MMRTLAIRSIDGLTRVAGGEGRLLVLTYHRVLAQPDPLEPDLPDEATFRSLMCVLRKDFRPLPLEEALQLQSAGRLPAGAVAVTFDDGFTDNVNRAWPILSSLGIPATFFIASGYLDGGWMFNSAVIEACRGAPAADWDTGTAELGVLQPGPLAARAGLVTRCLGALKYLDGPQRLAAAERLLQSVGQGMPTDLMMTREQVAALHAAGAGIGGHTRSHPILARLPADAAAADIAQGRQDLEEIIGAPVPLFAYPNGQPGVDYGPREVALVREAGFTAAFTTSWGYADAATDRYQLPRVGSWGDSRWRFSARLALTRARTRGTGCQPADQRQD